MNDEHESRAKPGERERAVADESVVFPGEECGGAPPHVPLVHVPAEDCSYQTAQTTGMQRCAGISGELAGSRGIWMGLTTVPAGVSSGPHHHGVSETGIYVVSGHPTFLYRDGAEAREVKTKPGDFVYVPPFAHHVESNVDGTEPAVVVISRTTQEAIVENLPEL